MMKIDIITLFPEMFKGPFDTSMLKKAQDAKLVDIFIHDLRKWTRDKHKTVDGRPFGGGKGMIIKVEPVYKALKELKSKNSKILLLSPQGKVFTQKTAQKLSKLEHIILLSGHYEGFDERIRENLIDEEVSIGDYILTGGELPAMVITDSIIRLIPGVLEPEAVSQESFSQLEDALDYPSYTRPEDFKGWKVPEILLSGNHAKIEKWRAEKSKEKTKVKRPDLLRK